MLDLLKLALFNLSDSALHDLAKDAEARIGSNVAGGDPVNEYIQRQQALLELIQEELLRR